MKVSVVIPMYNSERTIEECLNSVLNQTFKDFEIIVVSDGSQDSSVNIVEKLQKTTDKIQLLQKDNGGVSSARNFGLKKAKGEFIALLDSDDFWYSDKLEKQINILKNYKDIFFIGCNYDVEKRNRFFFKNFSELTQIRVIDLVFKNFFQPSTVVFRREIIEMIGFFDETQNYAEEGNYFMRIANKCKCVLLNEKLISYGEGDQVGIRGSGLSSNLIAMEKGEIKNINYALKNNFIGIGVFLAAFCFSMIKFIKRMIAKWLS